MNLHLRRDQGTRLWTKPPQDYRARPLFRKLLSVPSKAASTSAPRGSSSPGLARLAGVHPTHHAARARGAHAARKRFPPSAPRDGLRELRELAEVKPGWAWGRSGVASVLMAPCPPGVPELRSRGRAPASGSAREGTASASCTASTRSAHVGLRTTTVYRGAGGAHTPSPRPVRPSTQAQPSPSSPAGRSAALPLLGGPPRWQRRDGQSPQETTDGDDQERRSGGRGGRAPHVRCFTA
ncbi:killer cell lectin-like receptor subfamily G member 2 isoform X3 [Sus scrofa]|uniref:killer cell lectin-like receptor subfamily G member 2 isoform X3 n=1 Tax=Sus scrofa TaxID=9823 RepID=UPI000A2B6A80|nr:killer cell lectin-like receptor subfamily G member 2 isoform X3 [Sus scrofa]